MDEMIFYYFLRRSLDNVPLNTPYITYEFMGDISEFVEIDGIGYIIEDFAVEAAHTGE